MFNLSLLFKVSFLRSQLVLQKPNHFGKKYLIMVKLVAQLLNTQIPCTLVVSVQIYEISLFYVCYSHIFFTWQIQLASAIFRLQIYRINF